MNELKNMNELIDGIKGVLKKIKKSDNICLVHHDDSDGNCSAALFYIAIHNLVDNFPILFPIRGIEDVNTRLVNKLKNLNPDYVFVFDVAADPKTLSIFRGFILDHHIFEGIKDVNVMQYFNQSSFEKDHEKVFPVSFVVYKVLNDLFPNERVAWIAGIGITEDHRVDLCKEIFDRIKEETPGVLKADTIDQHIVETSFFGELCDMVRSGRMIKGGEGAETSVLALVECKDRPDKFVNGLTQHSSALRKFYDRVKYETEGFMSDVKKKGEFYKDKKVIIYEHGKTRMGGLTSFLADKIRIEYPEWVVCVINREYSKKKSKISIRFEQTKRDEDLVSIVEKIGKSIPSLKGGGHKSAVGVLLDLKDIDEFKEQFLGVI